MGILDEAGGDDSSNSASSNFSSVNRSNGQRAAEIMEEEEKFEIGQWDETNLLDGLEMKHVDDE